MDLLRRIGSIIWAMLRLINVLLIAIFSSIHNIIFNQFEVISMNLVLRPQGPERDKLSYIDKLYANNIEFTKGGTIPQVDAFDPNDPFMPDEYFEDDEDDGPDSEPPSNGDNK